MSGGKQQLHDIVTPHEHDVLSGRGNFVNYHAGNEHFRALVRKHKVAYVACPKPQKGKFSRMIVDEIKARNPPGRFLKQDPNTKLWHDIGEKKALDKTRQALREGAPEISKELGGDEGGDVGMVGGMQKSVLKNPGVGGVYGMNDGMGGFGAPDLKDEYGSLQMAQHAALSNNMMQQQQRMQPPPNQPMPRQMMNAGAVGHPGALYAGQIQRMQQQQQQQQQRQQQQRLQQQSLSRQLGGGQLGGMGLGGMGGPGMGMGGGIGGMGVNPYANFNNDYEELEPTPLGAYGQMGGQNQLLHAQAQLQTQHLQQMQQRQQQQHQHQQAQLQNQMGGQRSSLKDGNKRPMYARENSEQSINLGNAFEDTIEHGVLGGDTATDKNKQKLNGSQMSIMSLTLSEVDGNEDVGVAGDLSSMFDSSLQISEKRTSTGSSLLTGDRRQSTEKGQLLDMSVATIGNDMSTIGGFGSALGGEIEDSQAHMSFSHMFDDSEKHNV